MTWLILTPLIFGNVIDDALGDTVRVTVIAAGFDRIEAAEEPRRSTTSRSTADQAPARPTSRPPAADRAENDLAGAGVAPSSGATSSTSAAMTISTSTTTSTSRPSSVRRIAVAGTPATVVLSGALEGDLGPGSTSPTEVLEAQRQSIAPGTWRWLSQSHGNGVVVLARGVLPRQAG